MKPRFPKGSHVEVQLVDGGAWLAADVIFVWRAVDLETKRPVFRYDVEAEAFKGQRLDESRLRRRNRARGRRRVLRAHSVKPGRLT